MEIINGFSAPRSPEEVSTTRQNTSFQERSQPMPIHFSTSLDQTTDRKRESIISSVQADDLHMRSKEQRRFTVNSDKHLDITWKDQSLDGFIKFITKINLFQKIHQQAVPCLFTHFSEEIQNEVERLLLTHKRATYKDRS